MKTQLTIALSKGRILKETLPLLAAADIVPAEDIFSSRKLIFDTNHSHIKLVVIRATYVPTYVEYGCADMGVAAAVEGRMKVATKFVNLTREYFARQGQQVDIIKLYGAMELAPIMGLADRIVDIVDTGNTLRANGLEPMQHIADISSRLVVGQPSMKMKHALIQPILDQLQQAIDARREEAA